MTLEDGSRVEAYDATEILKAFDARLGEHTAQIAEIAALKTEIAQLKARDLPSQTDMEKVLARQNDLIKSLRDDVNALAAEGRGRRSVLNVHEKTAPAGAPQRPDSPRGDELLTKALIAQKQGRITGLDVARLESYLGRGLPGPQDILSRIEPF